jgi:hypothetical protein
MVSFGSTVNVISGLKLLFQTCRGMVAFFSKTSTVPQAGSIKHEVRNIITDTFFQEKFFTKIGIGGTRCKVGGSRYKEVGLRYKFYRMALYLKPYPF